MSESVAERPHGGAGHQNAAFEPDAEYIELVMIDGQESQQKPQPMQNRGHDNKACESDAYQKPAPSIPALEHDNNGYLGEAHAYQDVTPKGGSLDAHNNYYDIDLGQDAHEYENPDYARNGAQPTRPYGFNSSKSYVYTGKTEQEPNQKTKSPRKKRWICAIIGFLILFVLLVGAAVYVIFVFVINKPSTTVPSTQPSEPITTKILPPSPLYLVTTSTVCTLDLVYTPELADPNTQEYQDLEANLTIAMDDAFRDADFSGTYEGIVLHGFASGSIIAAFDVQYSIIVADFPSAPSENEAELIAFVETAVEAQVTEVLTAVSMDNSSSLRLVAFNVTGTDAEPVETSTQAQTQTQTPTEQPTEALTSASITSVTMTTPMTTPMTTHNEPSTTQGISECLPDQTVCANGVGCVTFSQFCDGVPQCQDESDELYCSSCPVGELSCLDGIECYSFADICDGEIRCTDGTDELGCPTGNCTELELPCDDQLECYRYNTTCDGVYDCTDGTDEAYCLYCPELELPCNNQLECYEYNTTCDGVYDCTDGTDEAYCSCLVGESPCLDGNGCYDPSQSCDGVQHCPDGSDELFCSCFQNELSCDDGDGCYLITSRCDGVPDCSDQSDEQNCTTGPRVVYLSLTSPYNWTSPNYPNNYPVNTDQAWLFIASEGYRPRVDILDLYTEPKLDVLRLYSDPASAPLELSGALTRTNVITYLAPNTSLYATFISDFVVSVRGFWASVTQEPIDNGLVCLSEQYDCGDGVVCMPDDKRCSCPTKPAACNPPTDCFSCDDGKCIPFAQECDGQQQCEFGEDERNCTTNCHDFLCNDGICVNNMSLCDMINDCTGGEDEVGCSYPVGEESIPLVSGSVYELVSLGYPGEYPNNAWYSWIFTAGLGKKVRLRFKTFSTHDANDYLALGDGSIPGMNSSVRLYGGAFVPELILSQGSTMWVTMVTDRALMSSGFSANVTSVSANAVLGDCDASAMQCGDHVCIPAENLCGVLPHCVLPDFDPGCPARIDFGGSGVQYVALTSSFLNIYSINFPARYGDNNDATLYLTAQAGQHILVATRHFDTEESYDFVDVYEGHAQEVLIASLSGLIPNQIVTSTGNEMTLVFLSDPLFSYNGFWMEAEAVDSSGCGDDEFACMNGQCRPVATECDSRIDCIDFSDEDMCPVCQAVPLECGDSLPWTTTIFPNAKFTSEADALLYYSSVQSSLVCHPSAKFLVCATMFPECPHYGPGQTPCASVCSDVIANCPTLSGDLADVCSGDTIVDENSGRPLCEAREGDVFNTSVCGTRPAYGGDKGAQSRIIGGTFAEAGEFPWLGSLRTADGRQICGATLINERWAITAAHCTDEYDAIFFGDLKIDTVSNHSVSPTITHIIDHPQYFSTSGGDDISLIQFSEAITFSDHVRPICLPTKSNVSETRAYRRCYAAGWGTLAYEGSSPNDLLKALLPLIENSECAESYDDIIPSKICAGYMDGGYDACQGDSGGPLACEGDDGRWHLIGITSYGNLGCGDPGFPGVYTRVSSFLDFIQQEIGNTN